MPGKRPSRDLRTFALAAVASALTASDCSSPETEFLRAQWKITGDRWDRSLARYLQRPALQDAPLCELAQVLHLSPIEILTVALASSVEMDLMTGRAMARVQAPLPGSRPTLGLLAAAFARLGSAIDTMLTGPALRSGLLQLLNEGAPTVERAVTVPFPVCLALAGMDGTWPGATIGLGEIAGVSLPPRVTAEAEQQAKTMQADGSGAHANRTLAIRCASISEGRSAACAIADGCGTRAAFIDASATPPAGLVPWLILRRLTPVFNVELAPGERKTLPALPFWHGPVLALCGDEGTLEWNSEAIPGWFIGVPSREERRELWRSAIGNDALADELAAHHRHGVGRIAHLGRLARRNISWRGAQAVEREDLAAAAWTGEGAGLDSLAQPLREPVPDGALITTPPLRADLDRLYERCRFRDGLAENLGVSASTRYRPGVRALFTGPSGTGKTLAASWLATRLGIPIYRVDLASITSKYIGETEKNLSQLMARAEHSEIMLLFDEADSLFGKRTEIRESNDRFANAQTNYLLQRIETFDGIALLTSNSRARFDSAFARRLDAIIEFPLPGPEERRSIWLSHLGASHALSARDLNKVAATADLCGGNIRNAVLAAAVPARAQRRAIEYADIVDGIAGEYRKLGRQMPLELTRN